jgi:threonine aldolase
MFGSDNQAPAHPRVLEAILAAGSGRAASYGADATTQRAQALVREVFETSDVDIHLVATGGAANGLALSALCPPWGAVACPPYAHILADEGSGPELFTGGARLLPVGAADAVLTPGDVHALARLHDPGFVHGPQPRVLSFTNLTELGTALDAPATGALAEAARTHGWRVHVDGARFANAVVATGNTPADLSWRSGVDALSFGLTKTGGAMCEAVLLFGAARDPAVAYQRKRAGQLVSKHRYLAAQMVALLEGALWLDLARAANERAGEVRAVLEGAGAVIVSPQAGAPAGNELFVRLSQCQQARLAAAGIDAYPWPALGEDVLRLVTSWDTPPDAAALVRDALAAATPA